MLNWAVALFLAVCLCCLITPRQAEAEITFDAVSNSTPTNTGDYPDSWTHVVGSGLTDSILIIGTSWRNGNGPTNVTVNGSSAGIVEIRSDGTGCCTESRNTALYYKLNPAAGNNNIVITYASGLYARQSGAASFQGVDQDNPIGNHNGTESDTDPVSVTVNTANANNVVVDIVALRHENEFPDITPDGSQTELFTRGYNNNYYITAGMSYKGPNSSGNVTMEWNIDSNQDETSMSAAQIFAWL